MKNTFVIAEAGANHDNNLQQAFNLIDVAKQSGANAVKFQTYSSDTLYSKYTPDFENYKNVPDLIKSLELPREWQSILKQYCDDIGIEFMSTPFDETAVDELFSIGVKRFKIAGFESQDIRLVKYIAKTGLPIIFSAGIGSTIQSIHDTIEWILSENSNCDISILHCNNAYPTPVNEIYLNTITDYLRIFPNQKIGLSDHTMDTVIPSLAVSLGATIIEKHFTLDRTLSGPDHKFAMMPDELNEMIKNIRTAELSMLGSRTSAITQSEQSFSKAMRSVVAKTKINAGELFTENNTTTKRPMLDYSIPANRYYDVIGKVAVEDIVEDEIITYSKVNI